MGKGGWQHTPDAPIYLASHRWVAILPDKTTTIAWARGGAREEAGREQCKNGRFNMVTDKESEPLNLDLPFPFPPLLLYPSTRYLELQISPCVSLQVRWEIRSEVLDVSVIWACCSFRFYLFYTRAFIYLSVTAWMYGFLFMNVRRYSRVIWLRFLCIQACTQGVGGYREFFFIEMLVCVCVCVSERTSAHCVAAWLWIPKQSKMGRVKTSTWNLFKTLFGFGSSQQPLIGEPEV